MPPSRKKRRGGNKGDRDFYAHNSDDDVRLSQEEASDSDDGSPQMGPPSSSLRSRTDNMSDFQKRKAAIDSTYDSMNPRPSGARQTMGGSRPKVKPRGQCHLQRPERIRDWVSRVHTPAVGTAKWVRLVTLRRAQFHRARILRPLLPFVMRLHQVTNTTQGIPRLTSLKRNIPTQGVIQTASIPNSTPK